LNFDNFQKKLPVIKDNIVLEYKLYMIILRVKK